MKMAASRCRRKAALGCMVCLLVVLAACGGGGGSASSGANNSGNNSGTPPAQGTQEYLYVSNTIGDLFGYFIDLNSGALSPIRGGHPFDHVCIGCSGGVIRVAADPRGTALYVSIAAVGPASGGPNVQVDLAATPNHPFRSYCFAPLPPGELCTGPNQTLLIPPGKLAVDPSTKNLYVVPDPSANLPEIISFTIAPDTYILQELLPTPVTEVSGVPHDVTVDPSGHYVYITFAGAAGVQVAGFSRDQTTGALTSLPNSPFGNAGGNNSQGIRFTPNGTFAVLANTATNNVSVMSLDATTGTLTNIAGSPFRAGAHPLAVAIDPSGEFVFVANEGDNTLSAYTIDAAGRLTAINGSPFTVTSRPQAVTVDPSGRFVYVATADRNVWGFTLNTATESLTRITGSPFNAIDAVFCPACGVAELRDIVMLKP